MNDLVVTAILALIFGMVLTTVPKWVEFLSPIVAGVLNTLALWLGSLLSLLGI